MLTDVHLPPSPEAAVELLGNGRVVLGGGTLLMPRLNDFPSPPTELVSLRKAGMGGVRYDGDLVTIGATTTLATLINDPRLSYLAEVARSIASPPVRSLATVGGNLFAPQPHGDLAAALLALDAEVQTLDRSGPSTASLESFLQKRQQRNQLVLGVSFKEPEDFRFLKATRRRINSAAIVTIAARVQMDGQRVDGIRVALGGVADRVVRAHRVEAALSGKVLSKDTIEEAAAAGLADIEPRDDAYASAWYRTRVFPVHLRRALLRGNA